MAELKGATVVKKEIIDEAGDKLKEIKRKSSLDDFLAAKKKAEEESVKPLSSDMDVMSGVDDKKLMELQAEKRLYGWDDKTRTALVLKLAFVAKKNKKGE